jgi:mevalonate kinase
MDTRDLDMPFSVSLYPAKLLLFGEYTVLCGSQALAFPLRKFGGSWQYAENGRFQYDLPKFAHYLENLVQKGELDFDSSGFNRELDRGLYFKSSIPRGYGAGSSGALVAAIHRVFGNGQKMSQRSSSEDLSALKQKLGKMESYFHGSSSGFDPLISYLKKGIMIRADQTIEVLEQTSPHFLGTHFFLLDTMQPRKTAPFVAKFSEKMKSLEYENLVQDGLVPRVYEAIGAWLGQQEEALFQAFHEISLFQQRHFDEMIPMAFKNVWLEGLSADLYKIKLCGAGGGGFLLGCTCDAEKTQEILERSGFQPIFI